MKKLLLFIFILVLYGTLAAQDTLKLTGKSFDSSAFANDDTLTRSDYLLGIGKVFQTLNKAPYVAQFVAPIKVIIQHMDEDDSALNIIKERLSGKERSLNIRNLQMFNILLDHLRIDNKDYNKKLTQYDSILDATKKAIFLIRKDSVIQHIFRDRNLWETFKPQLILVHDKWKNADGIIKNVNVLIDQTLARISNNVITIDELSRQADALLQTTGPRAFSKERRYLWESGAGVSSSAMKGFSKVLSDEKKITLFYFQHSRNRLYLLLLTALIFFYWIFYNFRSLKRLNKIPALDALHFRFINPFPVLVSLVFVLNLAPFFDLNAPAIYIESIDFLLMLALTALFWKQMTSQLRYMWIAFVLLFILLSITRFLGAPFYIQRWWIFSVNVTSCVLGIYALLQLKMLLKSYKVIFFVILLYLLFNVLAVICNLFGRVTLTQILSTSANTAIAQAIGLVVFVQLVTETFLLQIQSSRIRKKYSQHFEYTGIAKGISLLVSILSIVIWLIVFTTNLNLYDALNDLLINFLTTPRQLGSISFTFNGVILFLAIIWTANFLQKYIAYFFGDIGDDPAFDNKGPRSRLLITRLVLLIAGFLLAVAASGLPLDKITVILGALGIGIGLGLQNIVSNFVSGIILIFDRPLRIGDIVEIGNNKGRVKEISVRSSTLLTPEGAEVIIPNGDILSHNIVNWTLSNNNIRAEVSFMIEELIIDDDRKRAIKEIIQAIPDVLVQKDPEIFINTITSKSMEMKVYFWCKDVNKTELVRGEVYRAIYKYLKDSDIKLA
ncbi:mechanosensitive ion channel [Ginsengibacter hankyongi]|uniref:Mechanosensitive ion channel n=1 Tax=Ginsengibacter hankyongi TaxID=2607284 RepID=A0A5J5II50_9BACT|nr:mechanosensitive ion channel domain-containing protein [Ginsengibacter hankyongi]KAA9038407.1 mechanosensitive ion channel [Ginsengibacter hankyongi]